MITSFIINQTFSLQKLKQDGHRECFCGGFKKIAMMSMLVKEVFCSLGVSGSRQGRQSESEDKVDYMDLLMKMGIGNINIFINAGNNSYVDVGDIGVLLGSDAEFDDDYYYYDDDDYYTTNFMRTTTSTSSSTTTTTSTTTATESKKRRK